MSRKYEVASRKYKRSRPQPVVPARGPAADTLAGTARCADAGIESYGGRSPESIVFSGWMVLISLIAGAVLDCVVMRF